eukprot:COSAG01_NODE_23782_length_802_cov_0.829303_1_plen_256_part_10
MLGALLGALLHGAIQALFGPPQWLHQTVPAPAPTPCIVPTPAPTPQIILPTPGADATLHSNFPIYTCTATWAAMGTVIAQPLWPYSLSAAVDDTVQCSDTDRYSLPAAVNDTAQCSDTEHYLSPTAVDDIVQRGDTCEHEKAAALTAIDHRISGRFRCHDTVCNPIPDWTNTCTCTRIVNIYFTSAVTLHASARHDTACPVLRSLAVQSDNSTIIALDKRINNFMSGVTCSLISMCTHIVLHHPHSPPGLSLDSS